MLHARKVMVGFVLSLNLNGQWKVRQLFAHFQEIVKNYSDNFDGISVPNSMELNDTVTESKQKKEANEEDQSN